MLELLAAALSSFTSSREWEEYLRVQAKFHSYSSRNAILIASQFPEATKVAGYRRWKELNRQVVRGARAIRIVAPVIAGDGAVTGFRTACVFDISQTTGSPLPQPVALLAGDDPVGFCSALVACASKLNFVVEFGALPAGVNGVCSHAKTLIRIESRNSPLHQAKTLVHELAHACLHGESGIAVRTAEIEAESVAYVVCNHFGIDSASYSLGYISDWAGKGAGAAEAVLAVGERVQQAAAKIIAMLDLGGAELPASGNR